MTANGFRAENQELRAEVSRMENTIAALRAEVERLKTAIQRQANAVRTLEYSKKSEINILRQTHQQAHVAAMTLDSERGANAILTEENERLRSALRQIAGIDAWDNSEQGYVDKARAALEEKP